MSPRSKTSHMQPRAFLSYSHRDKTLCESVRAALQRCGLEPWSDADLLVGEAFTDQIQELIRHSHVFVPVLTTSSYKQAWIHQEIGYAVAMRVPCVPICMGKLPDGMIGMEHAISVSQPRELEKRITNADFRKLIENAGHLWHPSGDCALEPEHRAAFIRRYAERAMQFCGHRIVRNQGSLSSFSLPKDDVDHPSWAARYGDKPRSRNCYMLLRGERIALAKHASVAGLRLIVNTGVNLDAAYGIGVKRTRLCLLVQFLETMRPLEDKSQVALVRYSSADLTLCVGDWFAAESAGARPVTGVRQSVFITHAPTVSRRVSEFDERIECLVREQGSPTGRSLTWAIDRLRRIAKKLPPHPAWHAPV